MDSHLLQRFRTIENITNNEHTSTDRDAHHLETRRWKANQEIRGVHIPLVHSGGLIYATAFGGFLHERARGVRVYWVRVRSG